MGFFDRFRRRRPNPEHSCGRAIRARSEVLARSGSCSWPFSCRWSSSTWRSIGATTWLGRAATW